MPGPPAVSSAWDPATTEENPLPASDPAPSGTPCWIDLNSSDPDRATAFYGAILGWTADEPAADFGATPNFRRNGVLIAGMMRNDGSQ